MDTNRAEQNRLSEPPSSTQKEQQVQRLGRSLRTHKVMGRYSPFDEYRPIALAVVAHVASCSLVHSKSPPRSAAFPAHTWTAGTNRSPAHRPQATVSELTHHSDLGLCTGSEKWKRQGTRPLHPFPVLPVPAYAVAQPNKRSLDPRALNHSARQRLYLSSSRQPGGGATEDR